MSEHTADFALEEPADINDRIAAATRCEPFVVRLTNGLCIVVQVNSVGGIDALHSNPICWAAADGMAAELTSVPSPTGDFDGIASEHEMQARLIAAMPDEAADGAEITPVMAKAIAFSLAGVRPWERCHAPRPELDTVIPF